MRKKQDIMWEQSTLWESVEKWVTRKGYWRMAKVLNQIFSNK